MRAYKIAQGSEKAWSRIKRRGAADPYVLVNGDQLDAGSNGPSLEGIPLRIGSEVLSIGRDPDVPDGLARARMALLPHGVLTRTNELAAENSRTERCLKTGAESARAKFVNSAPWTRTANNNRAVLRLSWQPGCQGTVVPFALIRLRQERK